MFILKVFFNNHAISNVFTLFAFRISAKVRGQLEDATREIASLEAFRTSQLAILRGLLEGFEVISRGQKQGQK